MSSAARKESVDEKSKLVVLIVMDGFGIRASEYGNAILQAKTPALDCLWTHHTHALLHASGKEVGLSQGDPGNSEVGHLNIGSGQIVYQSQPRIDEHIRVGKFSEIPSMKESISIAKKKGHDMHLVGILSAAGVHGHIEHLFELMQICAKNKIDPYIHVILDGRDTGIKDGYLYLNMLKAKIQEMGIGKIASMSGRLYSMDRDHRWERTEAGYEAMTGVGTRKAVNPIKVLQDAYAAGESDEIFTPTTIVDEQGNPVGVVDDGDVVIFYNYREDRARQLTRSFVLDDFDGFERKKIKDLFFLTMTGYEKGLPVHVLFEPFIINSTIAKTVSNAGLHQLHIAETEKYAHITYFFNGGEEAPHKNEEFVNIPSPKVFDYATVPEMSGNKITDEVCKRIRTGKYSFVLINFANPDMLGHTGNLEKTVEAVQLTDQYVKDVVQATIEVGGDLIITADHGNAEEMIDESTGEIHTAHTTNPVPLIICRGCTKLPEKGEFEKIGTGKNAVERGILADIAPTALSMLGLPIPEEMTGIDLLSVKF